MNFNSHLRDSDKNSEQLQYGLTAADVAALTHYPSLDKLFHDTDLSDLNTMKNRLTATFQQLERVILRGSGKDSAQAKTAAVAVENALDFLKMLEHSRSDKPQT